MAEDKITIFGELESGVPGGVVMSLKKSVTYEELLNLRNQSRLQPGMQYRITDYETVCKDTVEYISAGNVFDIVVTADSSSTLKEEASVMHREGDTYFAHCNLAAWKIKYCLDNDTSRFNWVPGDEAEAAMFDGYAYQRKPEEDKTIGNYTYIAWYNANNTSAPLVYSLSTDPKPNRCVAFFWDSLYSEMVGEATFGPYREAVRHAKGVIYWMRDEWGNETPYDFKNLQFRAQNVLAGKEVSEPLDEYCYTFESGGDASVSKSIRVRNNVIKESSELNFCVMYGYAENNFLDIDCACIYIGDSSCGNRFGRACRYDVLRSACSFNVFEGGNYGITLQSGCEYATFKAYSHNITGGQLCKYNVFETNACDIVLEDFCSRNHFDHSASGIYLGKYSCDNYFGPGVQEVFPWLRKENESRRYFIEYFCKNHFEGGVINWSPLMEYMPTSDSRLQNLYVHSGDYSACEIGSIRENQDRVTIHLGYDGSAVISYGIKALIPQAVGGHTDDRVLLSNGDYRYGWLPVKNLGRNMIRSYKNVEIFDGFVNEAGANFMASSTGSGITGVFYLKDKGCFGGKTSGEKYFSNWTAMQSVGADYNVITAENPNQTVPRSDRIFENVNDGRRYYWNGSNLVEYDKDSWNYSEPTTPGS